jgi:hypothetical protein
VTLDRRHMAASLAVLGCAIAYNVWVFTRPAGRDGGDAAPVEVMSPAPSGTTGDAHAVLDPARMPALADVRTDRIPEWPRDPFEDLQQAPPAAEPAPAAPAPAVEAEPVVASILYSTGRRLAVIDGRIVRPGDRAGGATVVDILPKAVILERGDGDRRILELQAPRSGAGRK